MESRNAEVQLWRSQEICKFNYGDQPQLLTQLDTQNTYSNTGILNNLLD